MIEVGDTVITVYGISGIVIALKDGYWGKVVFIKLYDGRIWYCPIKDIV